MTLFTNWNVEGRHCNDKCYKVHSPLVLLAAQLVHLFRFDPTAESIDVAVLTSKLPASIRFLALPRQRYKSEEDSCSHLAVFRVFLFELLFFLQFLFTSLSVCFILVCAIISPSFSFRFGLVKSKVERMKKCLDSGKRETTGNLGMNE